MSRLEAALLTREHSCSNLQHAEQHHLRSQESVNIYNNYKHVLCYTLFVALYMLVLYFQVRAMHRKFTGEAAAGSSGCVRLQQCIQQQQQQCQGQLCAGCS